MMKTKAKTMNSTFLADNEMDKTADKTQERLILEEQLKSISQIQLQLSEKEKSALGLKMLDFEKVKSRNRSHFTQSIMNTKSGLFKNDDTLESLKQLDKQEENSERNLPQFGQIALDQSLELTEATQDKSGINNELSDRQKQ